MPQAKQNKVYGTLGRGLITEAGPLNFPQEATTDELNCDLLPKGQRKRRLGFDLENDYVMSSDSVDLASWAFYAINTSTWNTVGGDGNLNFTVLQVGPTLYFYDLSETPLSSGLKSFSIDLNDYAAPSSNNLDRKIVQMDTGKGALFVVGEAIESFYVSYDPELDDITTTQIDVQIRDFEGVDDELEVDNEPSTLSDEHNYNLKNQGWFSSGTGIEDPVTLFFNSNSKYPSNNKQWWQAKDSNGDFSHTLMRKFAAGNTTAPKGHFIIDAFYQDRSSVSSVANLDVVAVDSRPSAVAFFASRVWYAGVSGGDFNGNVYFTQTLKDDFSNAGKCHSENDPTSEDLSDLLATDGGVISIPEIGNTLALFPLRDSLIVLANNGIWVISGGQGGFKATDFRTYKISGIGIDGANSIVDVEGIPIWWGKTGISTIGQNEVSDRFELKNLTKDTIQTFYDDIPSLCKVDVTGEYDTATKRIYWMYRSTAPEDAHNRYRYDRILILDTRLGAFVPWELEAANGHTYYVGGIFTMFAFNRAYSSEAVTDSMVAVTNSAVAVTISNEVVLGNSNFINYLAFKEESGVATWTFGSFTNTDFMDWASAGSGGTSFNSYFETGNELMGDIQRNKQAVYVHCYFNKTESEYVDTDYEEWEDPSSCYMQAKWEWADHSNSGRYSPAIQVYRFKKSYVPSSGTDFDNGFPVVVTKNKIRGTGRALRLKFTSEEGKDFNFLGMAIAFSGNTDV